MSVDKTWSIHSSTHPPTHPSTQQLQESSPSSLHQSLLPSLSSNASRYTWKQQTINLQLHFMHKLLNSLHSISRAALPLTDATTLSNASLTLSLLNSTKKLKERQQHRKQMDSGTHSETVYRDHLPSNAVLTKSIARLLPLYSVTSPTHPPTQWKMHCVSTYTHVRLLSLCVQ